MDASSGRNSATLVLSCLSVDDEDLVGWTALVAPEDGRKCHYEHQNGDHDDVNCLHSPLDYK